MYPYSCFFYLQIDFGWRRLRHSAFIPWCSRHLFINNHESHWHTDKGDTFRQHSGIKWEKKHPSEKTEGGERLSRRKNDKSSALIAFPNWFSRCGLKHLFECEGFQTRMYQCNHPTISIWVSKASIYRRLSRGVFFLLLSIPPFSILFFLTIV